MNIIDKQKQQKKIIKLKSSIQKTVRFNSPGIKTIHILKKQSLSKYKQYNHTQIIKYTKLKLQQKQQQLKQRKRLQQQHKQKNKKQQESKQKNKLQQEQHKQKNKKQQEYQNQDKYYRQKQSPSSSPLIQKQSIIQIIFNKCLNNDQQKQQDHNTVKQNKIRPSSQQKTTKNNSKQKNQHIKIGQIAQKYIRHTSSQPKTQFTTPIENKYQLKLQSSNPKIQSLLNHNHNNLTQRYNYNNQTQKINSNNLTQKINSNNLTQKIIMSKNNSLDSHKSVKKTQRKNSPNIFISTKYLPIVSQFNHLLNQDLQKTKKPSNINNIKYKNLLNININTQQSKQSLKQSYKQTNFQKLQSKQRLKQTKFYKQQSKQSLKYKFPFKQQQYLIQKSTQSKQNIYYSQQNNNSKQQIVTFGNIPFYQQKKLFNDKKSPSFYYQNTFHQNNHIKQIKASQQNSIENLLSNQQIQVILKKLCTDIKGKTLSDTQKDQSNNIIKYNKQNMTSLNYIQVQSQQIQSKKSIEPLFSFKNILNQPLIYNKDNFTLRTTQNPKMINTQNSQIQSLSLSQRNKIQLNSARLLNKNNKLTKLDQGANTIITKYDQNSQQKSFIQQSFILFQCSKDLKQTYSQAKHNSQLKRIKQESSIKQYSDEQFYNFQEIQKSKKQFDWLRDKDIRLTQPKFPHKTSQLSLFSFDFQQKW